MPRVIDDEKLLDLPLHAGPGVASKRDLFKRAAIIVKAVKQSPGCTSRDVYRMVKNEINVSDVAINGYLVAIQEADLIKKQQYKMENGTVCNAWYLADWLVGSSNTQGDK